MISALFMKYAFDTVTVWQNPLLLACDGKIRIASQLHFLTSKAYWSIRSRTLGFSTLNTEWHLFKIGFKFGKRRVVIILCFREKSLKIPSKYGVFLAFHHT